MYKKQLKFWRRNSAHGKLNLVELSLKRNESIFYPNGSKFGRNTYVSVDIVIMKGKYDVILPWPFNKKERLY